MFYVMGDALEIKKKKKKKNCIAAIFQAHHTPNNYLIKLIYSKLFVINTISLSTSIRAKFRLTSIDCNYLLFL